LTELLKLADDDPDEAVRIATELLNKNPNDTKALYVIGMCYVKAERCGLGAALLKRVVELSPIPSNWINYGMAVSGCGLHEEAKKIFLEAWKHENSSAAAADIAMCELNLNQWQKALEWANKALAKNDKGQSALTTKGMAKLALGDYTGWDEYKHSLGGRFRKITQFDEESMWEGQTVGTLVAYGEQGLGDEIMYASCLADAKERCETLIVECDKRLEGMYKRSFPFAEVHGTRRQDAIAWPANHIIDASVPVGRLPEFFRRNKDAFPGKPYLKADPERVAQWKAVLKGKSIGLAWSGGSKHNHYKARDMGLEAFRPLIESMPDVTWVSLQYKEPTEEIEASGLPMRHFKRATLTDDYDDTAGLVGALDAVIGVHTSVHHLAGALGIPGVILVPYQTLWLYANDFPWYNSSKLFRQRKGEAWSAAIKRLMDDPTICGIR
jgi:tetratricopeptide (TPR) repeat protein